MRPSNCSTSPRTVPAFRAQRCTRISSAFTSSVPSRHLWEGPMSRSAASRRVAFVNWTRRQAGGVETYVDFLLTAVAETGCQVALWTEQDHPVERDCVAVPAGATEWCAALDEPERSLEALRRWSPSVLLVHGVADPVMEARLLAIAPAVFVAHTYTGTCISSRKTLTFPRPRPCDRVFGP